MTNYILLLILICLFEGNIYSQKSNIEVFFGYQKHDKRFSKTASGVDGLAGVWGTRYSGIMYKRQIYNSGKFEFIAGIGYARETNTFPTPYNHCFDNPGEPCSEVLLWIDKYSIDMLPISIGSEYQLNERFSIGFDLMPQFYFYKNVNGTTKDFNIGLYSIEANPSFKYSINRLYASFGFRLAQLKTIDRVYLYGNTFLTENPQYLSRAFDIYNPVKWILTLGFKPGKPTLSSN